MRDHRQCPLCFPWGFDVEDEGCVALKLILLHKITALRAEGIRDFAVAIDEGLGLYASEIINTLRESAPEMALRPGMGMAKFPEGCG